MVKLNIKDEIMSQPRISINKLGEYLQANPKRRKKIVSDAKNPVNYITTRYQDAKEAIKQYIINDYDAEVIDESIQNHEDKSVQTDFQEQDQRLSIELLEKVLDMELPDLTSYSIQHYTGSNPKLNIAGVEISVNPDLIIRGTHKGQQIVGAIKIHTSKSYELGEEGMKNVTTLLHRFTEEFIANEEEKTSLDLCISIDTAFSTFDIAPKSFKRRLGQIESACEEIMLWWDKL